MVKRWELKLAGGKVVSFTGETWEEAAQGYVSGHPDAVVVAWREARGPRVLVGAGVGW